MRKLLVRGMLVVFLGVCASLGSRSAAGVLLEFVPPSQTVPLGHQASVDVVISGTTGGAAPSIGAYDLVVRFDAAILSIAEVIFDIFLGQPLSLTGADISLPGVVDFAETSLLPPSDLDDLQPDRFRLATLVFDTTAAGTSPLVFSDTIVGDAFGSELPVETRTGSITVIAAPGTLFLVALGLAAIACLRRSRAADCART